MHNRTHSGQSGRPYTYFIGVSVSDSLSFLTEECRQWMGLRYGCKSGYRTEPHVTLIAPFALGADDAEKYDSEAGGVSGRNEGLSPREKLARILDETIGNLEPFAARVQGFGTFGDRTIYVRVLADPAWDIWRSTVSKAVQGAFPGMLPPPRGVFTPHLTVANRDIPPEAIAVALEYFSTLEIDEEFTVGTVGLFEFQNGTWNIVERFSPA